MSAIVLTAAAGVSDEAAKLAADAAGGEPWRRLGPCGVAIPALAAALPPAQSALSAAEIDVNWVAELRPRKLFLADMDSTIVTVECIDELAAEAGVGARVAAITEQAMRGELDFEGALRARVALLEGLSVDVAQRVAETRVPLSPGAETLVRTMNKLGALTALVSGGFTFFTSRVAARVGFQHHRANQLESANGAMTGRVLEPILGRDAKRVALEEYAAELSVAPSEAIVVGDGANDLAMVQAAGIGVAYRAKPALAEAADVRLAHSDLTALLHLQGVPADQFAIA
ncbi:MAG: phosphoserine phosphatase SerB [Neomegalonema sp.]|nr:phosphoserine phosphatase SerB [Neomegalonema sp.]